jgi:hypothetical protein
MLLPPVSGRTFALSEGNSRVRRTLAQAMRDRMSHSIECNLLRSQAALTAGIPVLSLTN